VRAVSQASPRCERWLQMRWVDITVRVVIVTPMTGTSTDQRTPSRLIA
jgi:hypothetical protein